MSDSLLEFCECSYNLYIIIGTQRWKQFFFKVDARTEVPVFHLDKNKAIEENHSEHFLIEGVFVLGHFFADLEFFACWIEQDRVEVKNRTPISSMIMDLAIQF